MRSEIEVRAGQVYEDVKEKTGRTLAVLDVVLQEKAEGRFKARYTYATVEVIGSKNWGTRSGAKRRIDTDRLRSPTYRLIVDPPRPNLGGAGPLPKSDAATPQGEP